ncbi:hypothetical protein VTH06DRAFT_8019 [Thermothelomyces fergusii]
MPPPLGTKARLRP